MIAEPHIEDETLQALLAETLSSDQAERIESHLCKCDQCQSNLEQLAGGPDWWDETVNVLTESTLAPIALRSEKTNQIRSSEPAFDASLEWIRPLLDPSVSDHLGRIDQYPISGIIGQGGMGVVLRGTDPALHRPLAIKILSPHLAGVGAAKARFMREAQAAAAIIHPSIVPIYSIATAGRMPYIVMPWISGGNLQERIDREGPLELIEILQIALQIAEGLAAAHRHGVIHRDIKPANMLIEAGNGRVLISDFGLARALDDATLTMSGMIAGTPQFMSPEQARGDVVDARSDLFSLGSLMYAMATGRPPFRAESPLAVLRKISDSRPRPCYEINERMPAWLDRIIARLMQVDRNKRIQTADQAVQIFTESLGHARNPAATPLPKSIRSSCFGKKWAVAVVMAPVLTCLALLAWPNGNSAESTKTSPVATGSTTSPVTTQTTETADDQLLQWRGESLEAELRSINAELDRINRSLAEPVQSADDGILIPRLGEAISLENTR